MMDYPTLQVFQLILCGILFFSARRYLRRSRISFSEAPVLIVLIGYFFVCALSNLFRYEAGVYVAVDTISDGSYFAATLWWCLSVVLTWAVYLATARRLCRWRTKQRGTEQSGPASSKENVPLSAYKYYGGALVLILVTIYFNPFSGRQYGIFEPRSLGELEVGGLLIEGVLFAIFSGLAIALTRGALFWAIPCLAIAGWQFAISGSKGMAAVFVGYLAAYFWRFRRLPQLRGRATLLAIALGLAIVPALLVGVQHRFHDPNVTIADAFAGSLGRFTQQDVASVLWTASDWRNSFRSEYIRDNIRSFLPGFLFPDKPINPGYYINQMYVGSGGPVSAASASFFGSLLIVAPGWAYWVVLTPIAVLLGALDWFFSNPASVGDLRFHYEWLYIVDLVGWFETTYVSALAILVALALWRYSLLYLSQGSVRNARIRRRRILAPLAGRSRSF
ncbi:MAG: hypothetical protein ABSB82_02320 [Terriglobia bacterium]|jgi:hypothetical protein